MAHELNKVEILEIRVNDLESELRKILFSDRYLFDRDLEMASGRNFIVSTNGGTKFGTSTSQLMAFYGNTPVNQPETVANPNNQGGTYVQADVQSIVGKVNEIIDKLQELGLIA